MGRPHRPPPSGSPARCPCGRALVAADLARRLRASGGRRSGRGDVDRARRQRARDSGRDRALPSVQASAGAGCVRRARCRALRRPRRLPRASRLARRGGAAPPVDARTRSCVARERSRRRGGLLRPGDELPGRGNGAGVHRGGPTGACRRYGGQPSVRAAARRPPLLPHRPTRDPAQLRRHLALDRPRTDAAPPGVARRPRRRPLPAVRAIAVPVKLLLVTLYFPPAGGGGVQRPLKFATHLPALGIETHVLAPEDPKWVHRDEDLVPPTQAWIHRVRYLGPKGRLPAEELHGLQGVERAVRKSMLAFRRVLVPDENVSWNLTAIPAAIRIAKREGIDVVVTTSPPNSIHLVGAAVKRATGAKWVADLRDSLVAHPHRRAESVAVRAKEKVDRGVARLVARSADAITCVSEAIAEEARSFSPRGPVVTISNGCDFDDFAGLDYTPGDRFRITHTGSFFGKRDPRPFLTALAESGLDIRARFLGDFRSSDKEWAEEQGLGDKLELIPYAPRQAALELQRDSEALLLLIPDAGGRGKGVLSGKVFEYLAAERPILALVPPDGAAAELIRETGAGVVAPPDDVKAIKAALAELHARFGNGGLAATDVSEETRHRLSRRARAEELAELLRSL